MPNPADSVPDLPNLTYETEARAAKRRYRASHYDMPFNHSTFSQSTSQINNNNPHRNSRSYSRDSESSHTSSHARSTLSLVSPNPQEDEEDNLPRASYAAHMRVARMIERQKAAQSTASLALTEEDRPKKSRVSRWVSKFVRPL